MQAADDAQRQQALDISRSFCVQAPAGSGKTELLTQRILALLAHVDEPEEVLAFTFTRKAAAEMRDRLLQNLWRAAELRNAPAIAWDALAPHQRKTLDLAAAVLDRDDRQGWQLLANARRLRLNTIDSFTAWLSAQLPLSASLGARANITTDMAPLFAEAIHTTLARLEQDDDIGATLRQLLPHLQNDLGKAESLLQALLLNRDQWLPLLQALEHDQDSARLALEAALADLVASELQAAQPRLAPFDSRLRALVAFAASNLEDQPEHPLHTLAACNGLPPTTAAAAGLWRSLAAFLLVSTFDTFRKPGGLKAIHGFPALKAAGNDKARQKRFTAMKASFGELCDDLNSSNCLPLLQTLARLPDPYYSARQWPVLRALCALLPVLAAQLAVAMQRNGAIDHTETSLAALRALGEELAPTDLALRLDYRIRHILVDEFQDTSSLQFHLLERLTYGWEAGDGRTLFIVGDGMQSCYAFRNAKVSLFLKARNEGIGGIPLEPLALRVNFRSDSSIVNWVNQVFSQAFPVCDDLARGGVRYSHSQARSAIAQTPGVQCRLRLRSHDDSSSAVQLQQQEAEDIARLYQQLQAQDPQQSIAILVRSRSHLRDLVPALRALGLRWNASKIDRLLSYPDINDLFTLLRALLNLADVTAWLALLRAPFVGLTLHDLQVVASAAQTRACSLWRQLQDYRELPDLSADARARLQRCVPPLQAARARRQHFPLRQVLETLWIALGGPACLPGPDLLPNVATFFALVEQHTRHGDIADIHTLEKALNETFGSAVDAAVNLQLMTIHNAKGLEFDTVLLPGLDRQPRANDRGLLLWHEHLDAERRSHPLFALLPEKGQDSDPVYDYLRFEHGQRDRMETTRLLYIGVTRASRAAWLFGTVKEDKHGVPEASASSLLARILPALLASPDVLQVQFEPVPAPESSATTAAFSMLDSQPFRRLPASWRPPDTQMLLPVAKPLDVEEPQHHNLLARRCGELVHEGLKRLVERGRDWLDAGTIPPLWRRVLAPLCSDSVVLDTALTGIQAQLRACADAPELNWLFHPGLAHDACELALVDYSRGYRRDLIIDRTFVDDTGRRWIIDYKSARPALDQAPSAFIEQQTTRYRPQLQNYAALFPEASIPPRLALLFTALPLLHIIDDEAPAPP